MCGNLVNTRALTTISSRGIEDNDAGDDDGVGFSGKWGLGRGITVDNVGKVHTSIPINTRRRSGRVNV